MLLERLLNMHIVCLDLEGVLTPEIWIEFSQRTGIPDLARTTRDEPDYNKLMRQRIEILKRCKLGLPDIHDVIADMRPLPGAQNFLAWLRAHFQVVILSDTFYEFAMPLMHHLNWPTLLCHRVEIDVAGCIADYHLRMVDHKRASVSAFKAINFKVIAVGDSYNDISMLKEADVGIFFRPPVEIVNAFCQFPVVINYDDLRVAIQKASVSFEKSSMS
jgi:phosphoserine/homoserine phosphotransferase